MSNLVTSISSDSDRSATADDGLLVRLLKKIGSQEGLTGSAFHFHQWTPHRRIALVLSAGQLCMLCGMYLRVRTSYYIQSLYPDFGGAQGAPMAKSLIDLSLFVLALGVALTAIAAHRWLNGNVENESAGE